MQGIFVPKGVHEAELMEEPPLSHKLVARAKERHAVHAVVRTTLRRPSTSPPMVRVNGQEVCPHVGMDWFGLLARQITF